MARAAAGAPASVSSGSSGLIAPAIIGPVARVPQPAYRVVGPDDDVAAAASELGFPCVVKPVSLSGSRGVIRVDDRPATEAAAARVRRILGDADEDAHGPLLVERFVAGDEV